MPSNAATTKNNAVQGTGIPTPISHPQACQQEEAGHHDIEAGTDDLRHQPLVDQTGLRTTSIRPCPVAMHVKKKPVEAVDAYLTGVHGPRSWVVMP